MTLITPKQNGTLSNAISCLKVLYEKKNKDFVSNEDFKKLIIIEKKNT